MDKEVVAAIIATIPAVLAPLASFWLQRQGFTYKAKELDVIEKRVQLIERLLALEGQLSAERRSALQQELADIARDLVAERSRERTAGATAVEQFSAWRRLLLAYEQPTMKASVYRGFFWFFLGLSVLVVFSSWTIGIESGDEQPGDGVWMSAGIALSGLVLYGGIGAIFRSAALRQHKQARASAAAASEERLGS